MTSTEQGGNTKRDASKLSFQLSSSANKKRKVDKPSSKPDLFADDEPESAPTGQRIRAFDGQRSVPMSEEPDKEPMVIPLPQDINTGRLGIRRKQDHLVLARIARGEDVDMDDAEDDKDPDQFDGDIISAAPEDIDPNLPLLLRNRRLELEDIADEDERFRADVSDRPDEPSLNDYSKTPIASYGEALLRGMDWKPGMQVGLNGRGLVKPIEFIPRPRGLGLGANASQQKKKHKRKSDRPTMVVAPDADGRKRHYRNLDEKLIHEDHEQRRYRVGAQVTIIRGRHSDMRAVIEQVLDGERFVVRFPSGEEEVLRMDDLSLASSSSSQRARDPPLEASRSSHRERERERSPRDRHSSKSSHSSSSRGEESSSRSKSTWMRPGITVRVVSKSVASGKLYLKRVIIMDVLSHKECTVNVDGKIVEGIKTRMIETALPKPGGAVLVLAGRHAGRTGRLESRNSKKDEAVVQHDDDLSFRSYSFEDVAEYNPRYAE